MSPEVDRVKAPGVQPLVAGTLCQAAERPFVPVPTSKGRAARKPRAPTDTPVVEEASVLDAGTTAGSGERAAAPRRWNSTL